MSKEEAEEHNHHHGKLPYNGYSDEFLDRLEPNGNIPAGKGDIRYGKLCIKQKSCGVTFKMIGFFKGDHTRTESF